MHTPAPSQILSLAVVLTCITWATYSVQANPCGDCQASCTAERAPVVQEGCQETGTCMGLSRLFSRFCQADECGPNWSFYAEAQMLQRSTTRNQRIFEGPNDTDVLNSKDMNFPLAYGPKIGAIRHGVCGWDLEVAYSQFDGFETRASNPGPVLLVTDVNGGLTLADGASANYRSALYSGELNLRRELCCDRITLLGGFRMIELDERFHSEGTAIRSGLVTLDSNAFNHLYGFQLGAEAIVFDHCGPLQVTAFCKTGIYENYVDRNIHRVETGLTNETIGARRNNTAFMGEAGLVATYAVTCRLAFRASAQVAWLESVALAPEQIGASNFNTGLATVDSSGGIFYYGGGIGLEYRF
jgi:hypothetical protein